MIDRKSTDCSASRTRYRKADGTPMTVREVGQRHGQSVGLPQFVGTAGGVADQMEAFIDAVGGDGFMLSPIYCPGAIERFVNEVVPELPASRPHARGIRAEPCAISCAQETQDRQGERA